MRLNEEIENLITNRQVTRRGCFDKRIAEKFTHTTLFHVSTGSWKNINDGLNFVTQIWKWLTKMMIQMPFTDGADLRVDLSDQEAKLLQESFQSDRREASTS